MSSSTPWITDSKYDPFWHYSEFARWIVENRELIKDKMIEENNIREQGNRGIGYVKPQMDEIMVFQKVSNSNSLFSTKDSKPLRGLPTYYYWFNYSTHPMAEQYLIDDNQIYDFLSVSDLESKDYSQLRRMVQTPNDAWLEGSLRIDWDFYRIKFKDIGKRTPLINWNEMPWSDAK